MTIHISISTGDDGLERSSHHICSTEYWKLWPHYTTQIQNVIMKLYGINGLASSVVNAVDGFVFKKKEVNS